jgi:hypothetical protein
MLWKELNLLIVRLLICATVSIIIKVIKVTHPRNYMKEEVIVERLLNLLLNLLLLILKIMGINTITMMDNLKWVILVMLVEV